MARILLVEDDAAVRTLMEHVLTGAGYQVDQTATATGGRMLLAGVVYDLVVADGVLTLPIRLPPNACRELAPIAMRGRQWMSVASLPEQLSSKLGLLNETQAGRW